MAFKTNISWCDSSHNFWTGCEKVSEGCKYCYMYRGKERFKIDPELVTKTTEETFYKPLKWKEPRLIFTCSWSDFFIPEADAWRKEAWKVIKDTPQHTWQILTKRPERILECLPDDWNDGYDNVWIGITVENQKNLEDRFHYLLAVKAKTKFLSIEPILGEIDLGFTASYLNFNNKKDSDLSKVIDWVIIGGESGNDTGKYKYRTAKIQWFEKIIFQCSKYNIPVFVKQLGTGLAKSFNLKSRNGDKIQEFNNDLVHLKLQQMPNSFKK